MADVQPPAQAPDATPSDVTASICIADASSPSLAMEASSNALKATQTTDIEAIQVPKSAPAGDVNDPATYKRSQDPDWKNTGLDDIYATWDKLVPVEELPKFEEMGLFLVEHDPQTARELEKAFVLLRRKFKCLPKKSQMKFVLGLLVQKGEAPKGLALEKLLVKKAQKSQSGVLVVTVLTSPYPAVGGKKQRFSCQWNCYYCPNEPDQPRSYLHDEPSVLRANRNDFDPVLQFCDRCVTLAMNGHPVDKIELLVLGGTWASYPVEYQENFIRDLFYAANTFFDREKRERHSLDEEKLENETAAVKIIGITLETRPDCITPEELRRFRRYGCTRVQLGIQHTDDAILKKINRGCTSADAVRALKLLRDCCYKTDIHLMPNLPGSDPEKDRAMFDYVLHSPDLQADQWKIYPCEITPWTVIKKWYDEGSYVPYPDDKLIDLLMDVKAEVHPWIRLNRVIRDIPSQYILGGMDEPNLRQVICNKMIARGTPCKCIRCREVKTDDAAIATAECVVREYEANEGSEYFISFETPDRSKICGFARLRLSQSAGGGVFPELEDAALIRELHVYGQLVAAIAKSKKAAVNAAASDAEGSHAQHTGFGTQLMMKAEEIARAHGYKKMAVIAGVGVRNFYRRLGFEVEGEGELMIKHLEDLPPSSVWSKVNSFVSDSIGKELTTGQLSTIAIAGTVALSVLAAVVTRRK
ncbi:putative elongator complex protein [Phytophthora cinnamomi]|uniref:putative elongator complex protein n=1 Tax=Phytophthora cinnamomi TaxID=4785 RepID=UPI00355A0B8A|nr:putative elongator complex protein [Phytophthora cinnamomi]